MQSANVYSNRGNRNVQVPPTSSSTGAGTNTTTTPSEGVVIGNAVERKRHRVACLEEPMSRTMYQLVIAQLYHDGFTDAADVVSASTGCVVPDLERRGRRLERLVADGLAVEAAHATDLRELSAKHVVERYLSRSSIRIPIHMQAAQLKSVYSIAQMKERFVSSSLGGVIRCSTFNKDGSLLLVGGNNKVGARMFALESVLASLNLSDLRTSNTLHTIAEADNPTNEQGPSGAISSNTATSLAEARCFSKHRLSVEAVAFHPTEALVLTGGREGDVFVWSYRDPTGVDQAKPLIQDTFSVRDISVSPFGDYALIATDHTAIRLANIDTGKLLTPPTSVHSAALSAVHFRPDGRTFATASFDGSAALHDLNSGRTGLHIQRAHSGVPVTSVEFSRTGNIVLTYGMDAVARLWDLRRISQPLSTTNPGPTTLGANASYPQMRTRSLFEPNNFNSIVMQGGEVQPSATSGVPVQSYGIPSKCEHRIKASFNAQENLIVAHDNSVSAVVGYDVYSGEVVYSCAVSQHAQRTFAVHPLGAVVCSGGDDCRLRLWTLSTLP